MTCASTLSIRFTCAAVHVQVAAHRTYAERRRAAGFGDELAEFLDPTAGGERGRPGQFPSRFCNLLVLVRRPEPWKELEKS